MLQSQFPIVVASLAGADVLCSGVIGRRRGSLRDLAMLVYLTARELNAEHVSDQATLNALSHLDLITDRLAVSRLSDAWVCHLRVAGPTAAFQS